MNNPSRPLSDEDLRQIARLMETLENSTFDFLQVEVGDLKVTLGKGDAPPSLSASPVAAPQTHPDPPPGAGTEQPPPAANHAADAEDGTGAITAPTLGRFYAQSEPGADPFVRLGDEVDGETTVGLIEVMKMFTPVSAGVSGVITEVCAENEEIVEYGQVLFRVRPA